MFSGLAQDVRYGIRRLLRHPGFFAASVLTLALGIGGSTAMFSLVKRVLIEPLPFEQPERLVRILHYLHSRGFSRLDLSQPQYLYYRQHLPGLQDIAVHFTDGRNLAFRRETERIDVTYTSTNLFSLLGVRPLLGRGFQPEEEAPGRHRVAVLEHGFWMQRFGGRGDVLGETVLLDDVPYTVVGVMPAGFDYPPAGGAMWAPIPIDPNHLERDSNLAAVGRLAAGVSFEQAGREMLDASRQYALDLKLADSLQELEEAGWGAFLVSLHRDLTGEASAPLLILLGAVGVLLLIACANVSGLLLARTAGRAHEIALRTAAGAGRGRIIRMLLVENLSLFLVAGAGGALAAYWGVGALAALAPDELPLGQGLLDWQALGFSLATSLLTGLLFGLLPALQASKGELAETLKSGGRGSGAHSRRRLWNGLVASEIALAVVLLVAAVLMLHSLTALTSVNPGYSTQNLLTLRISLPIGSYSHAQVLSFYDRLLDKVRSMAGVESAGGVSDLPLAQDGAWGWGRIYAESPSAGARLEAEPGQRFPYIFADRHSALPGYFETLGFELAQGRFFDASDDGRSRCVIVDEGIAATFWPGGSPLGKRIAGGDGRDPLWSTVVGVVRRVRNRMAEQGRPQVWFPYSQATFHSLFLAVRTSVPPKNVLEQIRRQVGGMDAALPVFDVRTMQERRLLASSRERFRSLLLGIFAALALAMAVIGIYAAVSYAFAQRRGEIGLRQALGAQRRDVLCMVVGQGLRLGTLGVLLGVLLAAGLTRFLTSLLFEVSPLDPLAFTLAPAILLSVAILACLLPALRALRVDPSTVLRSER